MNLRKPVKGFQRENTDASFLRDIGPVLSLCSVVSDLQVYGARSF